MNLPSFLSRKLTPRETLLVAAATMLIVLGITYALTDEHEANVATQVIPSPAGEVAAAAKQPVMPVGYQAETAVKDPFAVPPEYVPPSAKGAAVASGAASPANRPDVVQSMTGKANEAVTKPKTQLPELKLTGIAQSGDSRLAIIQLENRSQPYALNETVGPYRLIAVHEDFAVLMSPEGRKVIQLGR